MIGRSPLRDWHMVFLMLRLLARPGRAVSPSLELSPAGICFAARLPLGCIPDELRWRMKVAFREAWLASGRPAAWLAQRLGVAEQTVRLWARDASGEHISWWSYLRAAELLDAPEMLEAVAPSGWRVTRGEHVLQQQLQVERARIEEALSVLRGGSPS